MKREPVKLTVFIGSSEEAKEEAQFIQDLLFEAAGGRDKINVNGWWNKECFPIGKTFLHSLKNLVSKSNCAILLATDKDKTMQRGKETFEPINNIILEYGMFLGSHDETCTALAVVGNAELPSDLGGVNLLRLHKATGNTFEENNRGVVKQWYEQVRKRLQEKPPEFHTVLPRLFAGAIEVLERHPDPSQIDDLLFAIANSFVPEYSDNFRQIMHLQKDLLKGCRSIFAVDVLGPQSWVAPSSYAYLANQIRHYHRANATKEGFALTLDRDLHSATERAHLLAKERGLKESYSPFDDDDRTLRWSQGSPKLQYARILLWSKQELLSSVADAVLYIHKVFHIPLFFREPKDGEEMSEFILFEERVILNGEGFRSHRANVGAPPKLKEIDRVQYHKYKKKFLDLLSDPQNPLLFAIDQRKIWESEPF